MPEETRDSTELKTIFHTRAGRSVCTRLIRPEDAPLLVDLFAHLSPDTRRRRFNAGLTNVEEKQIWQAAKELASVDNRTQGGAVVALAEEGGEEFLVGVAQLARPAGEPDSDTAEVAVVVRDDYQQQGIGSELMRLLILLAQRMGVSTLTASIQADNSAPLIMLRKLKVPVQTRTSHGETNVRIGLSNNE